MPQTLRRKSSYLPILHALQQKRNRINKSDSKGRSPSRSPHRMDSDDEPDCGGAIIGEATDFVCHCWKSSFHALVDALEAEDGLRHSNKAGHTFNANRCREVSGPRFFWLDIFSLNQHDLLNKSPSVKFMKETLPQAIQKIGRTVVVLEPLDAPHVLQRAWCVWELVCGLRPKPTGGKGDVVIAISKDEQRDLDSLLLTHFTELRQVMTGVDVGASRATLWDDEHGLKQLMSSDFDRGMEGANDTISNLLVHWLAHSAGETLKELGADSHRPRMKRRLPSIMNAPSLGLGRIPSLNKMKLAGTISKRRPSGVVSTEILALMANTANLFKDFNARRAEDLAREALVGFEAATGEDSPATLDAVHTLATILIKSRQTKEAEMMFQRALNGTEAREGPVHPALASILLDMGDMYMASEGFKAAERAFRRALRINEELFGEANEKSLSARQKLAHALKSVGAAEAEVHGRKVFEGRRALLGSCHPDTLSSAISLGTILKAQRNMAEAVRFHRLALDGRQQLFGQTHPDTLDAVHCLGNLLLRSPHNFDEAEALFSATLKSCVHKLGHDHPHTLRAVNSMGLLFKKKKQLDKAVAKFRQAALGRERRLGADHAHTLQSFASLANCLRDQGKFDEAEPIYVRVISAKQKSSALGPNHESTLLSLYQFATLLFNAGRFAEAERNAIASLDGFAKIGNQKDVKDGVIQVGAILRAQGKRSLADAMEKKYVSQLSANRERARKQEVAAMGRELHSTALSPTSKMKKRTSKRRLVSPRVSGRQSRGK